MTTIPEMCMAYTEVYKTLRLEMGISMMLGVLLGFLIMWSVIKEKL